jgi:hypothetical protein
MKVLLCWLIAVASVLAATAPDKHPWQVYLDHYLYLQGVYFAVCGALASEDRS